MAASNVASTSKPLAGVLRFVDTRGEREAHAVCGSGDLVFDRVRGAGCGHANATTSIANL
jgi:hypothetical protein